MNVIYCLLYEENLVEICSNEHFDKQESCYVGSYVFTKMFGFIPKTGQIHRIETTALLVKVYT